MGVNVEFGATTDKLEQGVERAKSAVSSFIEPVSDLSSAMGDLVKSSGGLSEALGLIGGGAAGGALALLGYLKSANQQMLDLQTSAKEAGLSLEDFQKVKYVANIGGLSDGQFAAGVDAAAKKVNELKDATAKTSELLRFLNANHVKIDFDESEQSRNLQYLQSANRLIYDTKGEADKLRFTELLGFSREWVKVLDQAPGAFSAAMQRAVETGAVLGHDVVDPSAEFGRRWTESSTQWTNLFKNSIIGLTPYLDALVEKATQIFKTTPEWDWHVKLSIIPDSAADKALTAVGNFFKNLAIDVPAIDTASGGMAVFEQGSERAAAAVDKLTGSLDAAKTAAQTFLGTTKSSIGGGGPFAGAPGVVSADSGSGGGGPWAGAPGAVSWPTGPETKPPPAAPDSGAQAAREAIAAMQGEVQAASRAYQEQVNNINSSLALTRITEQQKTALTLDAINQRQTAELDAAHAALDALAGNDAATLAEKKRIENEITKILQEAAAARAKVAEQEAAARQKAVESIVGPVQGAWDSQWRGLLGGTESFGTAMKKVTADLVLDMIKEFEKLAVIKPLENLLTGGSISGPGTLLGLLGGGGGSGLGLFGSAASGIGKLFSGGGAAAATTAAASGIDNGVKDATVLANTTALGLQTTATTLQTTATTANTAADTTAAASSGGGGLFSGFKSLFTMFGIPALDVGGYVVSGGLAMIHPGETVVPAGVNTPFAAGGGGAGGGDINLSVNGPVIGTQAWLGQMMPQLARQLQAYQNLNPSTA
jgi:hypothetical protein